MSFFQSAQGNINNTKIKMADEEVRLNHANHESENVSDETFSTLESSDEEIYLFSKGKESKSKKCRTGRKSTWKASTIDDLIDCICSNEYAKMKLTFINNKA